MWNEAIILLELKGTLCDLESAQGLQNALFNIEIKPKDNLDKTSEDEWSRQEC